MSYKPDIIIFTETWIIEGTEGLYQLPGYEAIHACRKTQSAGISLFYKTGLIFEPIATRTDEVSLIHAQFSNSNLHTSSLLVTAVYMPDSRNFPLLNARMHDLLDNVTDNHILMGDFNVNVLAQNQMSTSYLDTILSQGYAIQNTLPTRPSSSTLIDHVISNFENTVCVTLENTLSDHNAIFALFNHPISQVPVRGYTTVDRIKTDFEGVSRDLHNLHLDYHDARSCFTEFHTTLTESIQRNTYTSIMKVKMNNQYASTWINETLIKLSKRKQRLLAKRNRRVVSATLHTRIAEVTKQVDELKFHLRDKDMNSKYGDGINSRTKWKNINELLGRNNKKKMIDTITN